MQTLHMSRAPSLRQAAREHRLSRASRAARVIAAAATAATLAGCAALKAPPDSARLAATELAHSAPPAAWKAGGNPAAVPERWLQSLGDARLVPLAEEALRHNNDMRLLASRVEAAGIAVQAAGGALMPEVNLVGRSTGKATGAGGQLSGLLLSASWEIDLWGRLRYGQRAAEGQFASAEADQRGAQQALVATLAKAWFLAAEAVQQQALVGDMTTAGERLVSLAEQRVRVGIGAEADVALARASLQSTRDSAAQIELALAQSRRALEMLLGRYPAAEIELPRQLATLPAMPATGVPGELLARRPDIVAAQRRVGAAFARVGEADAARLPRISLSAALSSISSSTFVLQSSDNPSLGLGAGLFYPVFNGGQLAAQLDLRSAEQAQAAAAFAVTAQRAFNEVESALAAEASLGQREAILQQGLAENQRALALEQLRFKVGTRDLRSVTQQQQAAYAAGISLLRVQTEQRVQRVQLHLALGGDMGLAPR